MQLTSYFDPQLIATATLWGLALLFVLRSYISAWQNSWRNLLLSLLAVGFAGYGILIEMTASAPLLTTNNPVAWGFALLALAAFAVMACGLVRLVWPKPGLHSASVGQ